MRFCEFTSSLIMSFESILEVRGLTYVEFVGFEAFEDIDEEDC